LELKLSERLWVLKKKRVVKIRVFFSCIERERDREKHGTEEKMGGVYNERSV
jgi:hypothetical protein